MKFSFLIVSLVFSAAAFATEPPNALLRLEAASGFVPSHLAWKKLCRVFNERVLYNLDKASGEKIHQSRRIVFTRKVRNLNEAIRLVAEARRGTIVKSNAPTDGNSYHYTGLYSNKTVELKQYYSAVFIDNNSPATKPLVEFVDANCK